MESVPTTMTDPYFDLTQSDLTTLYVQWDEPTGVDAGGSSVSIVDYELQIYDNSTGWSTVDTTTNTYYSVTGLTGGLTYTF